MGDNDMTFSFKNFFIRVDNSFNDKAIVTIVDKSMNSLFISFNTLEESMDFINNTIPNCFCINEIRELYMCSRLKFKKNFN
ncbi:MAG: hypothetical protein IKR57_05345 [Bacilli bacterium]|nr:hypothetical protein [Bacilli bacterium]